MKPVLDLIFSMIVRQYRLLLLTKELLSGGATQQEIERTLKVRDFVARNLMGQCRNFDQETLDGIYQRLVEVDERVKTGRVEWETALDTLIVGLTM